MFWFPASSVLPNVPPSNFTIPLDGTPASASANSSAMQLDNSNASAADMSFDT